jgi:NADH-quinone oxidoreductase subunit A
MEELLAYVEGIMSLFIYAMCAALVVLVMLSSYFLGERSMGHDKAGSYESGIKASDYSAYYAQYFFLAILFVIFDMESAFIYLWSVSIKKLSWNGFLKMGFFMVMLVLGLLYAKSIGAFSLVKPYKEPEHAK